MIRRIWDVTLTVADLSRAVAFYRDVLGLPLKYRFPDYAGFDLGGVELGLKTWGGMEPPRNGEPVVNFLVDDVDRACRGLSARGVKFTKDPEDTPWGSRIALFRDPDGNTLQLTQIDWRKYFSAYARGG
ncbi:bleomycin resistance protein [Candidatus Acetothermia bacterium]|nr:MAG: bleomycin resistance protein [Candidatus Acetothermia bacterium]